MSPTPQKSQKMQLLLRGFLLLALISTSSGDAVGLGSGSAASGAGAGVGGRILSLPKTSLGWGRLVASLAKSTAIRSDRVLRAMLSCDRAFFCCQDGSCNPYADYPMDIGDGSTITEPWVHSVSLEILASRLKPGSAALDVGSGSGFMAAAMACMISTRGGGSVTAIEHIPRLASLSEISIASAVPRSVARMIKVIVGDARRGGIEGEAEYDAVHVGACVPPSLLGALALHLKPGGRLVYTEGKGQSTFSGMVVGPQELKYIDRDEDGMIRPPKSVGLALRMVPIASVEEQQSRRSLGASGGGMSLLGGLRYRLTPRILREARLKRRLKNLSIPR